MNNFYFKAAALLALPMLVTGCIDDNYDLDDIDTTTRIPVNNLTVPMNVETIKIDNVIKLEDNENISVVEINGVKNYAIEKSGTVTSSKVSINPIHVNAPSIAPTSVTIPSIYFDRPAKRVSQDILDRLAISYAVDQNMASSFSFQAANLDKALVSIKAVESVDPIDLRITLSIPTSIAQMTQKVNFSDVTLELPKGLYLKEGKAAVSNVGTYNPQTGELKIDNHDFTLSNNNIEITLSAARLDATVAGVAINNHALDYNGTVGLKKGGVITLTPNGEITFPSDLTVSGQYSFSSFYVKNFSGTIDYAIEGIHIEPIDLSGLPDFLNNPETNIVLGNPQIYIGAVNTTADYHTGLRGTVALNALFNNNEAKNAVSPEFNLGWDKGVTRYNVALATNTGNLDLLSQYPNPEKYTFNGLNTILQSPNQDAGLPTSIRVDLDGLHFYGNAVNFPVKNGPNTSVGEIDQMTGEYTFFAPLSFEGGSQIVYSKVENDFGSEDLDKLNISKVTLSATASTTIPFDVILNAFPLDSDGKRIGVCDQEIVLSANSTSEIVLIISALDGETISHIDGIDFRAAIQTTDNGDVLSPEQTITLSNLRMTVDGYYETDF